MTILIKGMDMPKDDSGLLCIEIWPDGRVSMGLDLCGETVATAVEVSTPHGRLIDADELLTDANKLRYGEGWLITVENIEAAPTVIEAEENEND